LASKKERDNPETKRAEKEGTLGGTKLKERAPTGIISRENPEDLLGPGVLKKRRICIK